MDKLANRVLGAPLTAALAILCVAQFATWLPHYLTWPLWSDHDVFATLAQGWDSGLLPYRDLRTNNFPGATYLFWIVGRLFGWGNVVAFRAVDAGLVVAVGWLLAAWSRRVSGRYLAGVVAFASLLSCYLSLDYSMAAQRDWHAAILGCAGLVVLELSPGIAARTVSALVLACAFLIRPQVVLFLPGYFAAIALTSDSARVALGRMVGWCLSFGSFVALGFLPLIASGVMDDFLDGLRLVRYGGKYNQMTAARSAVAFLMQFGAIRTILAPLALILLLQNVPAELRRRSVPWLLAFAGISIYQPLGPLLHPYLGLPLRVVGAILLGILVDFVLTFRARSPAFALVVVLMVIDLGVQLRPEYTRANSSLAVVSALRQGRDVASITPPGYSHGFVAVKRYPWDDYRRMMAYLRQEVDPQVRVADLLSGTAVTGPAGRLPALPAESATWLTQVRRDDEPAFCRALEANPRSVVVWDPAFLMRGDVHIAELDAVVRRLYRPARKFGEIEVWERIPVEPAAAGALIAPKP